jgi:NAD(P)-dependent dehydrogenase (short-subunit alcohol dehydrogenase family)
MMLKDKVAVIYGAGGNVGGAVARAFAREGAKLFLSGRNLRAVEGVAADVIGRGGVAEAAQVDALDEQAVDTYMGAVAEKAGTVDISFCAISIAKALPNRAPLLELSAEHFALPITASPQGVRVVCLMPNAMPETATIRENFARYATAAGVTPAEYQARLESMTHLGRLTTLAELANAAAFLASGQASAMTGTVANLSGGAIPD